MTVYVDNVRIRASVGGVGAGAESGGWQSVRSNELLALHRVALQARDAVQLCEALGVHLGPLRAALAETPYRVSAFGRPAPAPPATEEP